MNYTLQVLKFIESKNKPGEFVEIRYFLQKIGFKDYDPMKMYIDELVEIGYLLLVKDVSSLRSLESKFGFENTEENPLSEDYGFLVKLAPKGEQYLLDNERTSISMKTSRMASWAAWFSGLVALLSFAVTSFQLYKSASVADMILKQDSIIIEIQSRLLSISDTLRSRKAFPEGMKDPQGKPSIPADQKK